MSFDYAVGFAGVAIGSLYIWKPNLYRGTRLARRSLAMRRLSPRGYTLFMRLLGGVQILLGTVLIGQGLIARTLGVGP